LRQCLEGYRVARLGWGVYAGAVPLTYGFWFSSDAGTFVVRLGNASSNRFYYQEHTVPAGGWNWITATIPPDLAGTWVKDNGAGLYFDILLGGRETTPAVPGVWTAGAAKAQTANSTNLLVRGLNCYVTGFIILPGIEAPSAARAPLIMRPYDQELVTCKRYWEKTYDYAVPPATTVYPGMVTVQHSGVGGVILTTRYEVQKRAAPAVTVYSPQTGAANMIFDSGFGDRAATVDYIGEKAFRLSTTASVAGTGAYFHYKADARL